VAAGGAGLLDHLASGVFGQLNPELAVLQRLIHMANQQTEDV
jgi:hypothetical protein